MDRPISEETDPRLIMEKIRLEEERMCLREDRIRLRESRLEYWERDLRTREDRIRNTKKNYNNKGYSKDHTNYNNRKPRPPKDIDYSMYAAPRSDNHEITETSSLS